MKSKAHEPLCPCAKVYKVPAVYACVCPAYSLGTRVFTVAFSAANTTSRSMVTKMALIPPVNPKRSAVAPTIVGIRIAPEEPMARMVLVASGYVLVKIAASE